MQWSTDWQTVLEREVLPKVDKPARYTGGEWNTILKDWDRVDLRFVVLYPDAYELGMSNLAIQILYDVILFILAVMPLRPLIFRRRLPCPRRVVSHLPADRPR